MASDKYKVDNYRIIAKNFYKDRLIDKALLFYKKAITVSGERRYRITT